ncbi:MAG TPA: hypothetical protein VGK60_07200 [Pedococcus sp.]
MSGRDLSTLLEHASQGIPDVDLAERAWARAVDHRRHRRRVVTGSLGALVAAVVAVSAVQSASHVEHPPQPAPTTPTTGERLLPDHTAYALMPLEGTEQRLPLLDVGLPGQVDLNATPQRLSTLHHPVDSVVAVYLRPTRDGFQPVLVTGSGELVLADTLTLKPLVPTDDATGPLGPRAVGGGHFVVFAQPGAVVTLDVRSGRTAWYAVPDRNVDSAGFTSDQGAVLARSPSWSWLVRPWAPGPVVADEAGTDAYAGDFRITVGRLDPGHVVVRQQGVDHQAHVLVDLAAPVTDTWGETLNTASWAASGAFFDQDAVHAVIRGRYGMGPIYQGLVAVDVPSATPHLLLAQENPDGQTGRFKGCCTVLGWADGHTVLYESRGVHGRWVLAWDVGTGTVSRVTRIVGGQPDGSPQPPVLALNVGWRQ